MNSSLRQLESVAHSSVESGFSHRLPILLAVFLGGLLVPGGGLRLVAQPSPTWPDGPNRVLDLDGVDACAELPMDLFTNEVVTIEGWVKWRTFKDVPRFFDFFSARLPIAVVSCRDQPNLQFERHIAAGWERITATNVLNLDVWHHITCVAGSDFAKLYLDGKLLSTERTEIETRGRGPPIQRNTLGRSNANWYGGGRDLPDLDGQIDEVRLWAGERTAEQIRVNASKRLTGNEPGLLGYWNFDDGTANDLSSRKMHGWLVGNAKIVEHDGASHPSDLAGMPPLPTREFVNGVLDLSGGPRVIGENPGKLAHVELPPGLFTNEVVTFEAWAKCRTLNNYYSSFVDFNHAALSFSLSCYSADTFPEIPVLMFDRPAPGGFQEVHVHVILVSSKWLHVAAVARRDSAKLYLNGRLITTNEVFNSRSLPAETSNRPAKMNFIGRSAHDGVFQRVPDFDGQIDEIRLWAGERSAEQIRGHMFHELTGAEPGLLALWNFNDGTARDATTNGLHGEFVGDAKVVRSDALSDLASRTLPPVALSGRVTHGAKPPQPLSEEEGRVLAGKRVLTSFTTDTNGVFELNLLAEPPFTVEVEDLWLGVTARAEVTSLDESRRLHLELQAETIVGIAGSVTNLRGEGIEGVLVEAVAAGAPIPGSAHSESETGDRDIRSSLNDSTPSPTGTADLSAAAKRRQGLVTSAPAGFMALTGKKGEFRFLKLPSRDYRLRAHTPGGFVEFEAGRTFEVKPAHTIETSLGIAPFSKGVTRWFTMEDGLVDNRVSTACIDSLGCVWLGSPGLGITRYDGLEFTILGVGDGLLASDVAVLFAETNGTVWVGQSAGVSRYVPTNNVPGARMFATYSGGTNGAIGAGVKHIARGPDGSPWFLTDQGVWRWRNSHFERVPLPDRPWSGIL